MAEATECQTPGAMYSTRVSGLGVEVRVQFPRHIEIEEEHAELIEANLHNAVELVLAPLFVVTE